jgi:hypothetical protein
VDRFAVHSHTENFLRQIEKADTLVVPTDPRKLRLVLVGEYPATLDALALLLRSEADLQVF